MHAIPTEFSDRIQRQFPTESEAFLAALDLLPVSSVRLNSAKKGAAFTQTTAIPWNTEGYLLSNRPRYTLDPLFHAGCYYPQESSSMVLQWVLKHIVPTDTKIDALDLCAAPGGKSLIIADFLKENGRLISNEIVRSRAHILNEVLVKWGSMNVAVTNNRPADFANSGMLFDLMVIDAPCSGEGMFRKDPDARNEWNTGSNIMCSNRQKEILSDVLPVLRENGILVYSTCTFAREENEEVIETLLNSGEFETIRWPVPSDWNVSVLDENGVYAMRFLPHRTPGEGFFISALKRVSAASVKKTKPKNVFSKATPTDGELIRNVGLVPDQSLLAPDGELYQSVFTLHELNSMAGSLYFVSPGVHIGRVVRHELIPAHALALAQNAKHDHARIELTESQANAYLRVESVQVDAPNGWNQVAFQSHPLGWIKVIGNRVNNYYPKEWRVKMKE